jgi:hypothetical protein
MLGQNIWNFHTIERITRAFGYIFEDISIQRINPTTSAVQTIKIPISLASKDKWVIRAAEDPSAGDETKQRHVQIVLPRLAYDLTNIRYDSKRKLSTINYRANLSGDGILSPMFQLNPVPMIFDFSLYMQARTLSDSYAILEQILAFFRPDYTVPIMDIPEMNIKRDIIITLMNQSHSDSYEGSFFDKRVIEWQLDFQAQGHIYPPVKTKPLINTATITDGYGDTLLTVTNATLPINYTYYVDPLTGNDSNSGLSIDSAWATTTPADAVTLTISQSIGYKLNGVWYLYRALGMTADLNLLSADIVSVP